VPREHLQAGRMTTGMQYPKSCTAVSVLMWCQAETIIRADFLIGRGIAAYFAPKFRFILRSWATVGLRSFALRFTGRRISRPLIQVNLRVHNDCDIATVIEKLHYLLSFPR
jgi:hypothetical protein